MLNRGMSVAAEEASGGLISLWNNDIFQVKACINNKCCIILAGLVVKIQKEMVFCNVYGTNTESERVEL